MKTLKLLGYPRDTDVAKFPDGTIKNQTDTEQGTPVVREVYGDVLTNMYALLRDVGLVANDTEDNEDDGYQILRALKLFANELNDVEQLLTINGNNITVPFNIDNVPNKYVFIGRASEDYNPGANYIFRGTGGLNSYTFTSANDFKSGEKVLVVIDQTGVRAVGLDSNANELGVFTVFGTPLTYNESSKMYYEDDGKLISDTPSLDNLQNIIRVAEGNATLYVYTMMLLKGHVLCFCWIEDVQTYKFYQFSVNDLSVAMEVPVTGVAIPVGSNNEPYVYTDGESIFITNEAGTSADENDIAVFTYDTATPEIALSVSRVLNANFVKTTNAAIVDDELITMIGGDLKKFGISTGTETLVGTFNTFLGNIFMFNEQLYFTSGEVAKPWTV
tara:strand:- start:45 stop:1208 length:1164 start_codon:yes stop_codon:yes gene_type:complete